MTNLGYWSGHKAEMTTTIKWNSENILGSRDEMGLHPSIQAGAKFKNISRQCDLFLRLAPFSLDFISVMTNVA